MNKRTSSARCAAGDAVRGAARWLPFLFGAMVIMAAAHGQTSGVAPLVSGDCTVSSAGVMTCAKTNGAAFAPSATTDTTNAANITSGTLPAGRTAALTGDVTKAAGASATTVNSYGGGTPFGSAAGLGVGTGAGQVVVNSAANTITQNTTGNAATATNATNAANANSAVSANSVPATGISGALANSQLPGGGSATVNGVACALGSTCSVVSQLPLPGTPNLRYEYRETSGTIANDLTGSGNNGTYAGSNLPTLTGAGIYLNTNSNVVMPSSVLADRTFAFAFYKDNIGAGTVINAMPTWGAFLTSSLGVTGFNLVMQLGATPTYSATTIAGAGATACSTSMAGFHTLVFVRGSNATTDLDHMYIDGVACTNYTGQVASLTSYQTTGNLVIGNANVGAWNNNGLLATMYLTAAWAGALAPADAQRFDLVARSIVQAEGRATAPVKVPTNQPQLIFAGMSITGGYNTPGGVGGGTAPFGTIPPYAYPALVGPLLTNQPAWTVRLAAYSGAQLLTAVAAEKERIGRYCGNSTSGLSPVIVDLNTNDLGGTVNGTLITPQLGINNMAAEVQLLRAAGCGPIFVVTPIDRYQNTYIDSYNALLYRQWKSFADGVIAFSSHPQLGHGAAQKVFSARSNTLNPAATVTAPGTGYGASVSGIAVSFSAACTTQPVATATSNSGGGIASLTYTTTGSGCTSAPAITIGGSGSGATATADMWSPTFITNQTNGCSGNVGDGTHPNCTGQQTMATVTAASLNWYFASAAGSTNVPAFVSNAYQMTASDARVELNATNVTANSTLTMPTCTGMIGAEYRITNSQSAFTVTLKTQSSTETINGVDYSSSGITIPANSTVTLRMSPGPTTTVPACYWTM